MADIIFSPSLGLGLLYHVTHCALERVSRPQELQQLPAAGRAVLARVREELAEHQVVLLAAVGSAWGETCRGIGRKGNL